MTDLLRLRAIIDSALTFAIIATDRAGCITEWSDGATHVLGWSEQEMLGCHIGAIFTPEENEARRAEGEMDGAIVAGRASDERWHMRKDGTRFWASGEMTPLIDEHGACVGFVKVFRDSTEEAAAQSDLVSKREQLSRMFEQAPGFMALLQGPQHVIELANPAYHELVGGREVVGRTVAEALPEAVEQGFLSLLDQVYKSGTPYVANDVLFAVQTAPGDKVVDRYVDFVYQPLRDRTGSISGIFVEGTDVTARNEANHALRESEANFRELFNSIDEGFCVIEFIDGPDGPLSDYVHVQANAAYERHAGIPNVVGQKVREMVPGEADEWVKIYGNVLRTGESVRFERELIATGRVLELAAIRIGNASRNQVAVLFQDVTARKQAVQGLQESEEKFRVFAQAVPNHVWAGRPDGELYWFNDRVYAYSGETFETLRGTDWVRIVHPDDLGAAAARWEHALRTGANYETEFRIRNADGAYRWFLVRAMPVRGEDGEIVRWIGTNTDVHQTRQQASELEALNATLEQQVDERTAELMATEETLRQAQKMEAVGQLTGGIAHDFNNLLTAISGSLEMMGRRIAQGRLDEIQRYIPAAQGAAKRAASLTHRLLAFSRQQTLNPQPIDINRLVSGMDDLVRRTVGPSITVETVAAAGLWPTLADPHQLENALLNLCINARDAMPGGGHLTIETGNRWIDSRAGKERDMAPGQYISMCVSDNGFGMSKEVIAKAFDPFFTTKPIGQGTGLGLSMIYGFARQSGGSARIYSEPGQGSMVCIYLPRHLGETGTATTDDDQSSMIEKANGETVLVVDDEPVVRTLMVEILEELGYRTIEAGDGHEGLRLLQSDVDIALLVSDVGMPGMNGRQLAEAARALRPDLKVLFVTGYAENAVLSHGHLDHGMHVVMKPFTVDLLAGRIEEIMAVP